MSELWAAKNISADCIFLILSIYNYDMYAIIILDFSIKISAWYLDKFNKSKNDDPLIKHMINEIISYLIYALAVY